MIYASIDLEITISFKAIKMLGVNFKTLIYSIRNLTVYLLAVSC